MVAVAEERAERRLLHEHGQEAQRAVPVAGGAALVLAALARLDGAKERAVLSRRLEAHLGTEPLHTGRFPDAWCRGGLP